MKRINKGIINFLHKQPYTVVSTLDEKGYPHNSCKGIVGADESGKIYLLDLYKEKTYENLKKNPKISITAVDEHKFMGFCLKGRGVIVQRNKIRPDVVRSWEDKLKKRISKRLLKNIKGEKGHPRHPEALLPKPEYLIEAEIREIIDLTPHHIKEKIN